MEYSKFLKLVKAGEKFNVDFKIQCKAFASKAVSPKGEIAKDICAMANNGYIASFILIGVSDDGKTFSSVSNEKITDDYLQDFCKKSIFPPPSIKVSREQWRGANSEHINKTFVIIQVGPNKRQAFRLNRDFISYKEKICYRRNEVWIRRGATSDLATPEEISLLVQGKPIEDAGTVQKRKISRDKFSQLSKVDQKASISELTPRVLKLSGYSIVKKNELPETTVIVYGGSRIYRIPVAWKMVNGELLLLYYRNCFDNLLLKDLKYYQLFLPKYHAVISDLPKRMITRHSKDIRAVRRIFYFPVITSVPKARIQRVLPKWRWAAKFSHYYLPQFDDHHGKMDNIIRLASSSELLLVHKILSELEYQEKLVEGLAHLERFSGSVISIV